MRLIVIKAIYILLYAFALGLIIVSICSCSPERMNAKRNKKWTNKGLEKGWLDTTTKKNNFDMPPDTTDGNKAINQFVDSIDADVKKETGKDLTPQTIEKIRWRTKTEFIPKYIKTAYKDTTLKFPNVEVKLWFDTLGVIHGSVVHKDQQIVEVKPSWWQENKIIIIMILGLLILLAILFIISKLKS